MASLLACAAFNAKAEVNPFSWGAKIGPSLSFATASDDTKINGNKASGKFFDTLFAHGGLYVEYAFNDYIGMGLEAGYMKLGGTLTEDKSANGNDNTNEANTTNSNPSSISMASHGVAIPLHLQFYPLGREEESGILKINVGITGYLPFAPTCTETNNGTETNIELTSEKKDELPTLKGAIHLGLGYELPFGLSIDAKYGYQIYGSKLKVKEGNSSQTIFNANNPNLKDNKFPIHHATIGVGFNFMSLLT
ncbi:outer membrane beta-barrel protein [Candidatus Cardinium hertigii]|uniref:outer membrane beta-barrel protein n=1 Tax=Candidatus Cardinium hertigii TaxID=247481 RepID=UPI003D7D123E